MLLSNKLKHFPVLIAPIFAVLISSLFSFLLSHQVIQVGKTEFRISRIQILFL